MTLRYAVGVMRGQPLRDGYVIVDYQGEKVAKWSNGAMAKFYDDEMPTIIAPGSGLKEIPPQEEAPKIPPSAPSDPPVSHQQAVLLANYVFSQPRRDQRQALVDTLDAIDWTKLQEVTITTQIPEVEVVGLEPPPAPKPAAPKAPEAKPAKVYYGEHPRKWNIWPALTLYRPTEGGFKIELSWLNFAAGVKGEK